MCSSDLLGVLVIGNFCLGRWINTYPRFLETKFMNIVSSRNITAFIILRIKFSLFYHPIMSSLTHPSQKTHHGLMSLILCMFCHLWPHSSVLFCLTPPLLPRATNQPSLIYLYKCLKHLWSQNYLCRLFI